MQVIINNLFSRSKYYRTGHIDMQKARFLEHERRFAAERRIKYRGTASVNLEVLHFACEKDEANIARLKNFFRKNGCDRLDIQNHLPAVIDQEQLDAAIRLSETSAEALMGHPRDEYTELSFPPDFRLECLHGLHRVQAAAEFLPLGDKRWIVDLYLAGRKFPFRMRSRL
jgi:hypothetical protein